MRWLIYVSVLALVGCDSKSLGCTSSVASEIAEPAATHAMSAREELQAGYVQPACRDAVVHCNALVATALGRKIFDAQMREAIRARPPLAASIAQRRAMDACLIPIPPKEPQPIVQPHPTTFPIANGTQFACTPSSSPSIGPTCILSAGPSCPPPQPIAAPPIRGYGPPEFQEAYNLTCASGQGGAGALVAVLTYADWPSIESDLATYRRSFGLPPCTSTNGCFKKVNYDGSASLPPAGSGGEGELEAELDVDMVSAICPLCRIALVETPVGVGGSSSPQQMFGIMAQAARTAAALHATALSVSLYWAEDPGDAASWNQPGMAIVVASGDGGYYPQATGSGGVASPSDYNTVISVGGTRLVPDPSTSRGWREEAWSGAGSGCSALIPKPSFQADAACPGRMQADVAFDADVASGALVYAGSLQNRFPGGVQGWYLIGGTSMAAPAIAGAYALLGHPTGGAESIYSAAGSPALNDIAQGTNGSGCVPSFLCSAQAGYDGPTGNGTPNGNSAFH